METTQEAYQSISVLTPLYEKDHQPYIDLIVMAVNWAHKYRNAPDHITDPIADFIIYISFLVTETESWISSFRDAQNRAGFFYRDPDTYWRTIARGLSTQEVKKIVLECLPNLDAEKYFPHLTDKPAPPKIVPKPVPRFKPSTAHRREKTITQFIADRAPSMEYLKLYVFLKRCTRNKVSSRGRAVYPYGQKYAAQKTGISLRTVKRIFSWLKREHIIFKRTRHKWFKESWLKHRNKCATWFVCSSLKQSTYFLDPKSKRPKKRSSGSPRK